MTPAGPRSADDLPQRMRRDDGTTLIELMVGMTILLIFMGMFTGAVVMMTGAMNKAQAVNLSSSQLNVAFANLDNTVRYATFISTPGPPLDCRAGVCDWYVELRTTNTGTEVCTQLRVDITTQQLQRRTWTVADAVAQQATVWSPIASGISNGAAAAGPTTQPFYLVPLPGNAAFQQLTVNLVAPAGGGSAQTMSSSSFTFAAVNSIVPVPAGQICQRPEGRPSS